MVGDRTGSTTMFNCFLIDSQFNIWKVFPLPFLPQLGSNRLNLVIVCVSQFISKLLEWGRGLNDPSVQFAAPIPNQERDTNYPSATITLVSSKSDWGSTIKINRNTFPHLTQTSHSLFTWLTSTSRGAEWVMVLVGVFARHFVQGALVPLSSSCAHLDRYHGDYKWVGELFHSFPLHSTLSAMFVATVGTRCGWGRTVIAVQVLLQNGRPSTPFSPLSVSAGNNHIWPNYNRHQDQHCLSSTHLSSKWAFTLVVWLF